MKKKLLLMAAAGVLTLTAVVGGTLAGFSTKTENQALTSVGTKSLSLSLSGGEGNSFTSAADTVSLTAAMPGEKLLVPYRVANSGDYDIYVRVVVNKYFLNNGKKLFDENYLPELIELETAGNGDDWLLFSQDGEETVLYYTRPIAPGESSSDFLDTLSISTKCGNRYADLGIGLDITADAVQVSGAEKAMPSEWGVYPVFAADGQGRSTDVITAVTE